MKKSREQKLLNIPPFRLNKNIISNVRGKHDKGELDDKEFQKVEGFLGTSMDDIEKGILGLPKKGQRK